MDKLLVISERYWPDGSGGELATHLIIGLLKDHFNITVVTGSKNIARHNGVEYIYEPSLSEHKHILWLNTVRLVNKEWFEKLLQETDVVYIPRFTFPIIPRAKKLGKKVVVHLHSYIPISYAAVVLAPYEEHRNRIILDDMMLECMKGLKHCISYALTWWMPNIARRWISQADKIICVSKRQASIISDAAPELADKIEVVYNPLPPELTATNYVKSLSETPTFLYLGGDSYIKGVNLVVKAARQLRSAGLKARIIVTGIYSRHTASILTQLGNVEIVGRVKYGKVIELYKSAWATLFPSLWEETYGYVVVESMATGTIPIASRVGGVPEVVGGTFAEEMLFEPGNINMLVNRIKELSMMPIDGLQGIGKLLREETLRRFNTNKIKEKLLSIF